MTDRITTLEEYYKRFPYPIEILKSHKEARERQERYLHDLRITNPWLAQNLYPNTYREMTNARAKLEADSKAKQEKDLRDQARAKQEEDLHAPVPRDEAKQEDDLPPDWKLMSKSNGQTYYEHTPTTYKIIQRPPHDMPAPIKIGNDWLYVKNLSNNQYYFFNKLTNELKHVNELPDGWRFATEFRSPLFIHTSGLVFDIFPYENLTIKKLNNDWVSFTNRYDDQNSYFNTKTGKTVEVKPDNA